MIVVPQQQRALLALTCCGRDVIVLDLPDLNMSLGHNTPRCWEYAGGERSLAHWSRVRVWCRNPRHRYQRVLTKVTIALAAERALTGRPTMVASHSRKYVASALERGDIDAREASAPRRGTVARYAVPLDSL